MDKLFELRINNLMDKRRILTNIVILLTGSLFGLLLTMFDNKIGGLFMLKTFLIIVGFVYDFVLILTLSDITKKIDMQLKTKGV